MLSTHNLHGAGLGLRRDFMSELALRHRSEINFLEVAPENWINIGGRLGKKFKVLSEQYPIVFHGLSLSIGGFTPLDKDLLLAVKGLMQEHNVSIYSEHLTYCADDGHLYDLLPIPFTEEAVDHVSKRIMQAQDILGHKLVLENASYYAAPFKEMSELDFINAVLAQSDCELLLDINNVYVNSINHCYDAKKFIEGLPSDRVVYGHIAGHFDEADDLKIDTHGANVKEDVWELLKFTYHTHGVFPTLLERDFNIPSLDDMILEVNRIQAIQNEISALDRQANG